MVPDTKRPVKRPVINSLEDLKIFQTDRITDGVAAVSFRWYHITADDEAYTGTSDKSWEDMSLDELAATLEPIPDGDIYPELPADGAITIAPDRLDEETAFIKRSSIRRYQPEHPRAPGHGGKDELLEEALRLETLSKRPHPYIVGYLGCRVRRGHITAIVMESLEWNLSDYAADAPGKFAQLDKEAFLAGIESAVKFMHSLGLAHNDINPNNIMVRQADDGTCSPVLIDFGSCGPFGSRLLTGGTPTFIDREDPERSTSHKRHDDFSLNRMREWWDEVQEAGPETVEG